MTDETASRIASMVRKIEAEYRADLRCMPPCARTAKNPDYVHAVHKASMCNVIAARIERGDHLTESTS